MVPAGELSKATPPASGYPVAIIGSDDAQHSVLVHFMATLGRKTEACNTIDELVDRAPPSAELALAIVFAQGDEASLTVALGRLKQRFSCPTVCIAPVSVSANVVFRCGADDVVRSPYDPEEFLWRLARFIQPRSGTRRRMLSCSPIVVDVDAREVYVSGERLIGKKRKPTRKEFDLLVYFLEHKEKVIKKEVIVRDVLEASSSAADNAKAPVCLLRRKLGSEGRRHLETVHGVGFKMTEHPSGPAREGVSTLRKKL